MKLEQVFKMANLAGERSYLINLLKKLNGIKYIDVLTDDNEKVTVINYDHNESNLFYGLENLLTENIYARIEVIDDELKCNGIDIK